MRHLLFSIFLLCPLMVFGQYDNVRQYLAPKYQNAVTTVEMRQAANAEGQIWQNLREVVYEQLYMNLSAAGKKALADRKSAWETYIETENDYLNRIYFGELQGTMWYPVSDGARAALYKERTEKLLNDFDLVVRSQAESELPPDLILGKWQDTNAQYTFSFFDNFTAFQGESVSTGLLLYKIALVDNVLVLKMLKAEDLSLIKQFEIVTQSYAEMTLKEGGEELIFKRLN